MTRRRTPMRATTHVKAGGDDKLVKEKPPKLKDPPKIKK
jgi:hypothetical protein